MKNKSFDSDFDSGFDSDSSVSSNTSSCADNIDNINLKNYINSSIDFKLYDLFGNNIESMESYPFIIISSNNILDLLQSTASPNIFKYNLKLIRHKLKNNDVEDYSKYVSPGFVLIKNEVPSQLLLLNKDICYPVDPSRLQKVASLKIGSIWSTSQAKMLSMIFSESRTISKNDLKDIYMLDQKFLTKYKNKQNEFSLLNVGKTYSYTINRNMFKRGSAVMKIMANDDAYITISDGKLVLKSKNTSNSNQEINYTVQGELKLGGKCLTKSIPKKDSMSTDSSMSSMSSMSSVSSISSISSLSMPVTLEECTNSDTQKWYPFDGSFISQYDTSCLSYEDDTKTLKTDTCTIDPKQVWNIEFPHQLDPNDYSIPYFKGKSVVLVEADDPWYLNKDITIPKKYIDDEKDIKNLNKVDYSHSDYQNIDQIKRHQDGELSLDSTSPNELKKPIENFNNVSPYHEEKVWGIYDIFNSYLCWILIIIIIVIILNCNT